MSANIELVYLIKKLSKKLSISSDYLALSSILSIIYKNNFLRGKSPKLHTSTE